MVSLSLTDHFATVGASRLKGAPRMSSAKSLLPVVLFLTISQAVALAQTVSLSGSLGTGISGGTATVNLNLTTSGGAQPAAIEWTTTYSTTDISSISVTAAGTAAAAGKTVICSYGTGTAICILYAMNQAVIADGLAAQISVNLTSTTAAATALSFSAPVASTPDGTDIAATASGAQIAIGSPPVPTTFSLACAPNTFANPANGSCTVSLSNAAPVGGFTVSLSSNSNALTVPASITVASGATNGSFSAQGAAVAIQTNAIITGTYNGIQQTTSVTLTPPQLTGVSCNPTTISGAGNAACTLTIGSAAPAGGFPIALTSNSASLVVPATATVAASTTSASFTARASAVSINQTATVTVSANNIQETTLISLQTVTIQISSLACTPSSIVGSGTISCTVTLSSAAPAGGLIVGLVSNSSSLVVPANVTVTSTNATFNAIARGVTTGQTAVITASGNNTQKTASVPLIVLQISSISCASTTLAGPINNVCTVSLNGAAPSSGFSVALYSNNANVLTPASITIFAGATSETFTSRALAVSTNQTGVLIASANGIQLTISISLGVPQISGLSCNPSAVIGSASALCSVKITSDAPLGGFVVLLSSNSGVLRSPASVTVAAGSTTASFTAQANSVSIPQTAVVTASANAIQQTASILLTPAAHVSSMSCNPASIIGPGNLTCTATLSSGAPSGGLSLALSSNSASLKVPAKVTVGVGIASASFIAQARSVSSAQTAIITVSVNDHVTTASISLNVQAASQNIVHMSGVSCTPSTVTGSELVPCSVALSTAASSAGQAITLTSSSSSVTVPSSITVSSGGASISFTAQVASVSSNQSATITAATNGTQATTILNMSAAGMVSSISCAPNMVISGNSVPCTVSLTQPAPSAGSSVILSGGGGSSLSLPGAVVVPQGSTSATFSATGLGTAATALTITASYNGSSQSCSVFVSPPVSLSLLGSPAELRGSSNGSSIIPNIALGGFSGSLVVQNSGSVNFSPDASGNGVYFLNCCSNNANAYYKFTNTAVGSIFGAPLGQITFYLKSRSKLSQRATATSYRTTFDVRDSNTTNHVFYFTSQVVNGRLVFSYTVGGAAQVQLYYVPQGTQDTLFGSGITLKVAITWDGATSKLFLNDVLVQSGSYSKRAWTWGSTSNFNLGATEFLNMGGFDSCDDVISNFTVGPIVQQ